MGLLKVQVKVIEKGIRGTKAKLQKQWKMHKDLEELYNKFFQHKQPK